MKKILILAVAMMFSITLFAQTKVPEINKEFLKIIEALEKNGGEQYDIQIIPEDKIDFFMSGGMTVNDFIEYLSEINNYAKSSTLTAYALAKIPRWDEFLQRWVWRGLFMNDAEISGSDWDGVFHYVEYFYDPQNPTHQAWTANPYTERTATCSYCTSSLYKACGKLYENSHVYVQGLGWIWIKVPYGTAQCVSF